MELYCHRRKIKMFWKLLVLDRPTGCCWPPHYVLTFSLFAPIFSWQIKLNCWSAHGASLTPLEWEMCLFIFARTHYPHFAMSQNQWWAAPWWSKSPSGDFPQHLRDSRTTIHTFKFLFSCVGCLVAAAHLGWIWRNSTSIRMSWALLLHNLFSGLRSSPTLPQLPLVSNTLVQSIFLSVLPSSLSIWCPGLFVLPSQAHTLGFCAPP